MSDDVKHLKDDLFNEGTNEDDVKHDSSETTSNEDESSDLLDDLPSKREQAKNAQIQGLVRKIKSGEKSLEDLKSTDQAWLLPEVEKLVGEAEGVGREELVELARQEARKIIDEERGKDFKAQEDIEFEKIKKQINGLARTKEQTEKFKSRYNLLLSEGVKRSIAAKTAAEVAGIDFEEDIAERKRQINTPKVGWGGRSDDDVDLSKTDPNTLSPEQRQKAVALRMQKRGLV